MIFIAIRDQSDNLGSKLNESYITLKKSKNELLKHLQKKIIQVILVNFTFAFFFCS